MVVKILGIELEANLLNPDVADIYEAELKNVARKSNESKECESMAAGIRMQCQAVIAFNIIPNTDMLILLKHS